MRNYWILPVLIQSIVLFVILFLISITAKAACTTTVSVGANLQSIISAAAAGSTICLNSGNYGTVTLTSISKTSPVTIVSASGVGAQMYLHVNTSNNLVFDSLTFWNAYVGYPNGDETNTTISNSNFVSGGGGIGQLCISGGGVQGNLVKGNTFSGITVDGGGSCGEGRLQVYWPYDLMIIGNTLNGGGCSDGINLSGPGGFVVGNRFDGLLQGGCSAHVDNIQAYSSPLSNDSLIVTGNYFTNGSAYLGFYSGVNDIVVANNSFGPTTTNGSGQIQFLAVEGGIFTHNTNLSSFGIIQGNKTGDQSTTNIAYTNNVFVNAGISDGGGDVHGCASGCTYDHNLFDSGSYSRGTNQTIATPAFTGGSTPSTQAGFQLTTGSAGHNGGTDAHDLGTLYYGGGIATQPVAPSGFYMN